MKHCIYFLFMLVTINAWADNSRGFYVGGGVLDTGAFEYPTKENSINVKSIELFGGYKYNALLGFELRYGEGFKSKQTKTSLPGNDGATLDTEYEIDSITSIYYKPELINDEAKLYALLGYVNLERSVKFNGSSGNTSSVVEYVASSPTFDPDDSFSDSTLTTKGSGFSYGLGFGFVVTKKFNINVEYRILLDQADEIVRTAGVYFDYRI